MNYEFLVCYRQHQWDFKRTISWCFSILRLFNFIIAFTVFLKNKSPLAFILAIFTFLQKFQSANLKNFFSLVFAFLQYFIIQTKVSKVWWAIFLLFLFIIIPFLRYFFESYRKCAIWKWDECTFAIS